MPASIRNHLRRQNLNESRFRNVAQRILRLAGHPRSNFNIELVGDDRIRSLNRKYRRHDRPTDVLAFAAREAQGPASSHLGDVVISVHTARRQARTAGHSLDQEVVGLLTHGVLHLLGYDHERSRQEARRMLRKERSILAVIGQSSRFIARGWSRAPRTSGLNS